VKLRNLPSVFARFYQTFIKSLFHFLPTPMATFVELPVVEPGDRVFTVSVANEAHSRYAAEICAEMEASAKVRGTGIAKRKPEYIEQKMREGKAVIALASDGRFAGFCYIETWSGKKFVANSGLIVAPEFRKDGLAKRLKRRVFELSRELYPEAKIFGITTSHAVMKINTELGYVPVPFSEITNDDTFWSGCSSCPNFDILTRTERKMCLCTGMLYDPNDPRTVDAEFLSQLNAHPPDDAPPKPPIDLEPYT
jgi:GNAT superfamily N-acetyltransferase